jgi:hypothetical protein
MNTERIPANKNEKIMDFNKLELFNNKTNTKIHDIKKKMAEKQANVCFKMASSFLNRKIK